MRQNLLVFSLVCLSGLVGHAQIVVYDPAVTFRNSVTATLKEYLLTVQREQHSQLRRMAQRLSVCLRTWASTPCRTRPAGEPTRGRTTMRSCSQRPITRP